MASRLPGYRLSGETEADESCSGGVRKGGRGRCADGKIVVAGPSKRRGKVYAAVIPDAQTGTLMPVTGERVEPDGIVYTDRFTACNASDVGAFSSMRHRDFCIAGQSCQRDGKLLEPGREAAAPIQRNHAGSLLLVPEGV